MNLLDKRKQMAKPFYERRSVPRPFLTADDIVRRAVQRERQSIRIRISSWWRHLHPWLRFFISVMFAALVGWAFVIGALSL